MLNVSINNTSFLPNGYKTYLLFLSENIDSKDFNLAVLSLYSSILLEPNPVVLFTYISLVIDFYYIVFFLIYISIKINF